jgi:hypothetical protein
MQETLSFKCPGQELEVERSTLKNCLRRRAGLLTCETNADSTCVILTIIRLTMLHSGKVVDIHREAEGNDSSGVMPHCDSEGLAIEDTTAFICVRMCGLSQDSDIQK